jgi:hypothetical protein
MLRFFSEHSTYAVHVADIPNRLSLDGCAEWLGGYVDREVQPRRYRSVHILAFISGGLVLRRIWPAQPITNLSRLVYVRSPIQELTLQRFRERYGRFILWALRGRLALDVAGTEADHLAWPTGNEGKGLIIETGISQLARSLGVGRADVPSACWAPTRLLPGADDVLRVPQSHDEVYTSNSVLEAVLHFFGCGRFAPLQRTAGPG